MTTQPLFRSPAIFSAFPNLIMAESTRHGGCSPSPYTSLNVGINTNDAPDHIAENQRRLLAAIGAENGSLATAHQVHGTECLYVTQPGRYDGVDALLTDQPGLLVGVTVADCVPILLYDPAHQAVAAVHAGWRGTAGNIVAKTIEQMQAHFQTHPALCYAYIGTCIDDVSYEIGAEVAAQFEADVIRTEPGADGLPQRYRLDLKAANVQACRKMGIPAEQIGVSAFSTVLDNDDYFSYRAESGETGRFMALIGLKP